VYVCRPARWGHPYRVEQRSAGVLWAGLFLDGVVVCDDAVQVTWPDPVPVARFGDRCRVMPMWCSPWPTVVVWRESPGVSR